MTTDRDAMPDYLARERLLNKLPNALAFSFPDLSILLDIPMSTLDKLRAQGKGPKCFRIGRRLYCRPSDAAEWIDRLVAEEAA